jgi:hypothetical protein
MSQFGLGVAGDPQIHRPTARAADQRPTAGRCCCGSDPARERRTPGPSSFPVASTATLGCGWTSTWVRPISANKPASIADNVAADLQHRLPATHRHAAGRIFWPGRTSRSSIRTVGMSPSYPPGTTLANHDGIRAARHRSAGHDPRGHPGLQRFARDIAGGDLVDHHQFAAPASQIRRDDRDIRPSTPCRTVANRCR